MKLNKKQGLFLKQTIEYWQQQGTITPDVANDLNQSSSIRPFDWERLAKYSFWIFMIYAVIAIAAMTADKFLMELIEKIFIDSKIIPCLIFAAVAVANVGQHYGKPVLFIINTPQMYKHGFEFYQAENGVWLTIHIPTQYLSLIDQTKTGSSV